MFDPEDSAKQFNKLFKIPKSRIKEMQKQYADQKEVEKKIDPDEFKEFSALGDEVMSFFQELTGKKSHKERVLQHLIYYFEEGFEPPEMIDYIRHEKDQDFYKTNKELLTLARLFPIKDEARITIVWDFLSHFLSLRESQKKKLNVRESIAKPKVWSDEELMREPHLAMQNPQLLSNEQQELAFFFMKHDGESPFDYMRRTHEKRVEMGPKIGLKIAKNLENYTGILLHS